MANEDVSNLLKAGIQAAKAGNKVDARRLFEQVLELDDANEMAWMWFAMVVDTPREKRICLENVLDINPGNQRAREALERLGPNTEGSSISRSATPSTLPLRQQSQPQPSAARPAGSAGSATPARAAPRQGNNNSTILIIGGIFALALIGLGVFLLVGTPAAPTPTVAGAGKTATVRRVANAPIATQLIQTPPPNGTLVGFTPDFSNLAPSWTPPPSATPGLNVAPSATLPPLGAYNLLYIGDGRPTIPYNSIYTIRGDGQNETVLVSSSALAITDESIANNGKLAFVYWQAGALQIFIAEADGTQLKALTKFTKGNLSAAAISPDASRIAFISDQTGSKEIYLMNADGSNMTQITKDQLDKRDLVWSPDGTHLAFAEDLTGQGFMQIVTMLPSGDQLKQITTTASNYAPAWSPDGKMLAFVSTKDRYPNIYTISLDNPNLVTFVSVNGGTSSNIDPTWTPDGRYIIFSSDRNGKAFDLYAITPQGQGLQRITTAKGDRDNSTRPLIRPQH